MNIGENRDLSYLLPNLYCVFFLILVLFFSEWKGETVFTVKESIRDNFVMTPSYLKYGANYSGGNIQSIHQRLLIVYNERGTTTNSYFVDSAGLHNINQIVLNKIPEARDGELYISRDLYAPNQLIFASKSKWGVMDFRGNIIIDPSFDHLDSKDPVSKLSLARLKVNEKTIEGYINERGEFVIVMGATSNW